MLFRSKKLSNIVLILLSIICFIIALYQFSVLYLFLLADLLCCAFVYVIFKSFYQKKIYPLRSLVLIMIGLCLGLLFFPSTDFSKSLLVGVIFNKSLFSEFFTNYLLFWSFLFSSLTPFVFDKLFFSIEKN